MANWGNVVGGFFGPVGSAVGGKVVGGLGDFFDGGSDSASAPGTSPSGWIPPQGKPGSPGYGVASAPPPVAPPGPSGGWFGDMAYNAGSEVGNSPIGGWFSDLVGHATTPAVNMTAPPPLAPPGARPWSPPQGGDVSTRVMPPPPPQPQPQPRLREPPPRPTYGQEGGGWGWKADGTAGGLFNTSSNGRNWTAAGKMDANGAPPTAGWQAQSGTNTAPGDWTKPPGMK